ncbi:MAG: response regulator [Anaerolineales bacterium]|nr:response regulator [Anaerolineales bacterium]
MAKHPQLILLVESDLGNYSLLRDYLNAHGYVTATVSTAAAAREFLQQVRPNLILLDLMLPDETGLALLRWLRYEEMLCSIPIIVQTAPVLTHEQIMLRQLGATAVLTKPYSLSSLAQTIQSLLPVSNGQRPLYLTS